MSTLYDIPVNRIDGTGTTLGEHKGEVLLIVNVASKCGLTPQYDALEKVYESFKDRKFSVLGFPANDFGAQEPGTDAEIQSFCSTKFDVQFPLYSKIVVTGEAQHPLYAHLTAAVPTAENSGELRKRIEANGRNPAPEPAVLWNFEKFLVNRQGMVVRRFSPDMAPNDPAVIAAIESELTKA
jgi:glutathione peroxidase